MRLLPRKRPASACSLFITAQRLWRSGAFPTVLVRSLSTSTHHRPITPSRHHGHHHGPDAVSPVHPGKLPSRKTSTSSSSASMRLLALTPQSFKLADLYCLAASLEVQRWPGGSTSSNWERLLVDSGTGSALLRRDVEESFLFLDSSTVDPSYSSPIFLQRCQWVGRVLASGPTPNDLVHQIRTGYSPTSAEEQESSAAAGARLHWTDCVRHPWTLQYVCLGDNVPYERPTHRRSHTANRLLCATAQAMGYPAPLSSASSTTTTIDNSNAASAPPPAALSSSSSTHPVVEQLLLLDTWNKTNSESSHYYLLQKLQAFNPPSSSRDFQVQWTQRPFEYSSALNLGIAELILDILMHLVQQRPQPQTMIRFLDPCCGSGTLLAGLLYRSANTKDIPCPIHVTGYDVNDKCVLGTRQNLLHALSNNNGHHDLVELWSHVEERDSSLPSSTKPQSLFDCSACNLPWDLNTKVDSVDENRQILTQLRRQLKDGAPCAIVSKGTVHDDPDNNNNNTPVLPWEQLGFRVLGQAQVPPKDFQLPVGKKKPRKSNAVERPVPIDQGRSHCLVTIVEAV